MIDSHWHMQPNKAKVLMLAKRLLPEFICDAVNLEGISYTLPEIQTLLDGITVGGYKVSDQQVALNQHQAWLLLFQLIQENTFAVTAETACAIHAVAAKDDALEWGKLRSGGALLREQRTCRLQQTSCRNCLRRWHRLRSSCQTSMIRRFIFS